MLLLLAAATRWKRPVGVTRRIAVTDAGPVLPVVTRPLGRMLGLAGPRPVEAALPPDGPCRHGPACTATTARTSAAAAMPAAAQRDRRAPATGRGRRAPAARRPRSPCPRCCCRRARLAT